MGCTSGSKRIASYLPGGAVNHFPPGVAKLIPKGTTLNLNMHYNPKGTATTDKTTMAFVFAKGPIEKIAVTAMSGTRELDIPPGDANYEAKGTPFVFAEADISLAGVSSATISGYLLDCATTPCAAIAQ